MNKTTDHSSLSAKILTLLSENSNNVNLFEVTYHCIQCNKAFSQKCNLKSHMKKYTVGRNHISATSVTGLSHYKVVLKSIWKCTLGRSHINAMSVIRLIDNNVLSKALWKRTPGRIHISVINMSNFSH